MTRSNLLSMDAFVWALYIYMEKMLRIYILDISSKDYDPIALKLDEELRHKIAKIDEPIENLRWPPLYSHHLEN